MTIAVSWPRRFWAFSLIELLTVLAVMAVVASLAAPSFRDLLHSWRLRAEANQMISAIWLARATALRSGKKAMLCPLQQDRCTGLYQDGFGVFNAEGALIHRYQSRPEVSVTNALVSEWVPLRLVTETSGRDWYR